MMNWFLATLLSVFAVACTAEANKTAPEPASTQAAEQAVAYTVTEPTVHDAKCGCSIDGVRRCGNYMMVDGKYVTIVWPELGKMEWCAAGDNGAKIEVTGAMADGKFVAKSYKLVE
jgi:hypothetical protein